MATVYEKTCLLCGQAFQTTNKRQRYCIDTDRHMVTCPICGVVFERKSTSQHVCHLPHEATCFGCGKPIMIKRYIEGQTKYTCGQKACKQKLREYTNLQKYGVDNPFASEQVKEKIKQTNLEKYGTEYASQSEQVIKKQKETNLNRYGVEHPLQNKIIKEKAQATTQDRYGVDNVAKLDSVKDKIKETVKDKYGVDHVFQSPSVLEKADKTKLEKYGTTDPRNKNEDVRKRAEKTNIERYGALNPASSEIVKDKIKASNNARYGVEWTTQSPSIQAKMKQTLMDNYGVDNPMRNEELARKAFASRQENQNHKSILKRDKDRDIFINKLWEDYGKDKNIDGISKESLTSYLLNNGINNKTIADYFNITKHSAYRVVKRLGLRQYVALSFSEKEQELTDLLEARFPDLNIIHNDRELLDGQELDFYFPEHKLAIEISPTSTHNTLSVYGNKNNAKSTTYHRDKFLACVERGVELITVFDWHDWDKITEMIITKLSKNTRIYARKTTYAYYENLSTSLFQKLSDWHILSLPQNYKRSRPVSVLISGHEVVGIALWEPKTNSTVELKRMVFKPGVNIVGGASKLVKHYLADHPQVNLLTTFSDCDLGSGNVYRAIGFDMVLQSKPVLNYWSDKYNLRVKHYSLVLQGADRLLASLPDYEPTGLDGALSNDEIVLSYGFLPVYDCGYRKWEYVVKP